MKTYSNTYVNFYVALSTTVALAAGYGATVEWVVGLMVFAGLATLWWGVLLLKERRKR